MVNVNRLGSAKVAKAIVRKANLRIGGGPRLNPRQKNQVKRLIANQEELKRFPVYAGYTTVNATGTITKWSTIAQGDTQLTRDGIEIQFKKLDLRYNMYVSAAAANITNAFRIIVFQWKPDDSASPPGVSSIIDTSFTQPVFSPLNRDTNHLYRVMYDKMHSVYNAGNGSVGVHRMITNKRCAKTIKYATGVNTGENQIYVLVISDAAVQVPSWSYGAYLYYTDS